MKIWVNLYGTLSQKVPGYRHSRGIEVEVAEEATISDLLAKLDIEKSQKAVVAIDGRIYRANEKIPKGARAQVFQPLHGG
jgi:sulfur carrier protein ThiS